MPDSAKDEIYLQSALVVVAAHPDDETIGLSRQLTALAPYITLIYATDGAPANPLFAQRAGYETRDAYAAARRHELYQALEVVGVKPGQVQQLGYRDQEAARYLVALSLRLRDLLRQLQPKFVFTHPYEGGHPDHDACAFACRAAITALEGEGMMPPALMEFTSYHRRDGQLRTFEFLANSDEPVHTVALSDAERERKRRMYDAHRSQAHVLANFPIEVERHRTAPVYTFLDHPHEGELHYETFPSGMTGEEFVQLSRAARQELTTQGITWDIPS